MELLILFSTVVIILVLGALLSYGRRSSHSERMRKHALSQYAIDMQADQPTEGQQS